MGGGPCGEFDWANELPEHQSQAPHLQGWAPETIIVQRTQACGMSSQHVHSGNGLGQLGASGVGREKRVLRRSRSAHDLIGRRCIMRRPRTPSGPGLTTLDALDNAQDDDASLGAALRCEALVRFQMACSASSMTSWQNR